jgi:hypothetical protein
MGAIRFSSERHTAIEEIDAVVDRYNHRVALGYNDGERAVLAMKGIEGKRLTYRPINAKVS